MNKSPKIIPISDLRQNASGIIKSVAARESHNNLSSLEKRHLTKCGETFTLEYFKEFEKSDINMFVDSIAGISVGAVKECHKLFNSEEHESIATCEEALEKLRKTT